MRRLFSLLILGGWLLQSSVHSGEHSSPNVVVIISDDHGYPDFGYMGHPEIKTPQLDRLASESLVFKRGYVTTSICSPSLATMLTGLYPHQHGHTGNDPLKGVSRKPFIDEFLKYPQLPALLQERGYLSLHTGKYWQGDPARSGFTHHMGATGRHGSDVSLGIGRDGMQPIYDFIGEAQAAEKPFLVWYAPFLPHTPHNPPKRLLDKYKHVGAQAEYYAMVDWLDETCGELLGHLDDKGLRDNTVILFISDNGWGSLGKGSVKSSPYELGVRTPISIRWPGEVKPGMDEHTLASNLDIFPTVLDVCGAEPVANLPGISLLDAPAMANRKSLFLENYTHDMLDVAHPEYGLRARSCVQQDWKLTVWQEPHSDLEVKGWQMQAPDNPVELFNLTADPMERKNLAATHPDKVAELKEELDAWWVPAEYPKSKPHGLSWKRTPGLVSRWSEELLLEKPLNEYPRPSLVRKEWRNLNGVWDFLGNGPVPPNLPTHFPNKALVPSATQAVTSCLDKDYERGWYAKTIEIPADWAGKKVRLHCEAIGTKSTLYFDGVELGSQVGGFERVSYELPKVRPGAKHQLLVYFDDTDDRMPRGKAHRLSGLWQSVWMEPVAEDYILSFQQTPDVDRDQLMLKLKSTDPSLRVVARAFNRGKQVAVRSGTAQEELALSIPNPNLWSPEDPFLYDLSLELIRDGEVIDRAESYFGMRKISRAEVDGAPRILLNNEVYYQTGLLEHGLWPDSGLTPPSDECLKWEIQTAKAMGFNTIRTHLKIESERWYYWCDKLGMLIWQDVPRQNAFVHKAHETDEDKQLQRDTVRDMITQFYNHPSIISWVLFNEANGQFEPEEMTVLAQDLDQSRLINATSHVWLQDEVKRKWRDLQKRYNVDYYDAHCYERNLRFYDYDSRHLPAVFGEFGGIGYEIKGHTLQSDRKPHGYGENAQSADELMDEYEKLVRQAVAMRDSDNLCAIVYTELIDYKEEVNGFITFDRNVVKVDPVRMHALNMLFRNPSLKK